MQTYLEIHQATVSCATDLLSNENRLVELLKRGVQEQVHRKLGYGSLKEYCLRELHFSEERTYALIAIVNASLRVPEMSTLIQEGKLSISNARRIAKRIEPENKEIWLEKATQLSQHQLEKEIAKAFPEARVKERIRPIAENLSSLLLLINDRVEEKWNRLSELLLEKKGSAPEKMEILEAALDFALKAIDPVQKAERAAQRAAKTPARAENSKTPSSGLSARTIHEVTLRDRGQCTHLDPSGQRCTNRAFLHIHHIKPRHEGGTNEVDNLTTHCSTHHRFSHQNDAYQGPGKQPVKRSPQENKNKNPKENPAWKKIPLNLLQASEAKLQPKLEAKISR